jgi:hypothetical protein
MPLNASLYFTQACDELLVSLSNLLILPNLSGVVTAILGLVMSPKSSSVPLFAASWYPGGWLGASPLILLNSTPSPLFPAFVLLLSSSVLILGGLLPGA